MTIHGKVQGVRFRYTVALKAESLDIKVYVINQRDGSVFVAVEGETTAVDTFYELALSRTACSRCEQD